MKYTLAITQKCNLACDYCYIGKKELTMSLETASNIIEHAYANARPEEIIDFGFFGGEPLLEFDLIKKITHLIKIHAGYSPDRVNLSITTNGTVLNRQIIDFVHQNTIVLCLSCDGPPEIQDRHRHFKTGRGASGLVEQNIRNALSVFPLIPVNAVFTPDTLERLPESIEYLCSLGVERIFVNPDISAAWSQKDAWNLPWIYGTIGRMYIDYHLKGKPKYFSLIDSKIAVILNGGYKPLERCQMGDRELAFAPSGNIYPCERLIGPDSGGKHRLGNINNGEAGKKKCNHVPTEAVNIECMDCGIAAYCMNWCGCTNYAMTGNYNTTGPFLCSSEKASINAALEVIRIATDKNITLPYKVDGLCLPG